MCAVFGFIRRDGSRHYALDRAEINVINQSRERGRDGLGISFWNNKQLISRRVATRNPKLSAMNTFDIYGRAVIGNLRAEPTTEFVRTKTKEDQQPYSLGNWSIVHNGTIANDTELRTNRVPTKIDSAAIVEQLQFNLEKLRDPELAFYNTIDALRGSYAILATTHLIPGVIFYACNYRPLYIGRSNKFVAIASSDDYLDDYESVKPLAMYSKGTIHPNGQVFYYAKSETGPKTLVVCSGGLDSTVAATVLKAELHTIELLHFQYGARPEANELHAVQAIGAELGVPVRCVKFPLIYSPTDSPLLNSDSKIAGGIAGSEFAHEWVPARNLVMLSMATAMAEAWGFDNIALGNNLEEAGAYPDNEPEFIRRFRHMLPLATGVGRHVDILQPVGNLMKHEIVALGQRVGAPMHLTWSCYHKGEIHCGKCGPCFMRKTAFKINKLQDSINYIED